MTLACRLPPLADNGVRGAAAGTRVAAAAANGNCAALARPLRSWRTQPLPPARLAGNVGDAAGEMTFGTAQRAARGGVGGGVLRTCAWAWEVRAVAAARQRLVPVATARAPARAPRGRPPRGWCGPSRSTRTPQGNAVANSGGDAVASGGAPARASGAPRLRRRWGTAVTSWVSCRRMRGPPRRRCRRRRSLGGRPPSIVGGNLGKGTTTARRGLGLWQWARHCCLPACAHLAAGVGCRAVGYRCERA